MCLIRYQDECWEIANVSKTLFQGVKDAGIPHTFHIQKRKDGHFIETTAHISEVELWNSINAESITP